MSPFQSSSALAWARVLGLCVLFSLLDGLFFNSAAQATPLVVNEYNAVASGSYLAAGSYKNGVPPATTDVKQDAYFATIAGMPDGRIEGNGGNWIELVVLEDHLDIRGWQLRWAETGAFSTSGTDLWFGNPFVEQGVLTFSATASEWSDLRSGTILTISEKDAIYVDTDWDAGLNDRNFTDGLNAGDPEVDVTIDLSTNLSFDPAGGDWWMHVSTQGELTKAPADQLVTATTNVLGDGPGNFSIGPDDWQVSIFNQAGDLQYGPIGEADAAFRGGLNDEETAVMEADLNAASFGNIDYNDRTSTTFGMLNEWDNQWQEVGTLRDWALTLPTDFDGDGDADLDDLNALTAVGNLPVGVVVSGATAKYNLVSDNTIDSADLNQWLTDGAAANGYSAAYLKGDANLDGDVDVFAIDGSGDAQALTSNLGMSAGAVWGDGDFNGDGDVDVFAIDGSGDAQVLTSNLGSAISDIGPDAAAGTAEALYNPATGELFFDVGEGITIVGIGATEVYEDNVDAGSIFGAVSQKGPEALAYFNPSGLPTGEDSVGLVLPAGLGQDDIVFSYSPIGHEPVYAAVTMIAVPEPSTILMLGVLGLIGILWRRRRA